LAVKHFNQFADISLKPNSFYWVDLNVFGPPPPSFFGPFVGWGVTNDVSGPGVLQGYNSSSFTDGGFFPNKPTPPPNNGLPPFQMEVLGAAVPEPSTWALMLVGFALFTLSPLLRAASRIRGAAVDQRWLAPTDEADRRTSPPARRSGAPRYVFQLEPVRSMAANASAVIAIRIMRASRRRQCCPCRRDSRSTGAEYLTPAR